MCLQVGQLFSGAKSVHCKFVEFVHVTRSHSFWLIALKRPLQCTLSVVLLAFPGINLASLQWKYGPLTRTIVICTEN